MCHREVLTSSICGHPFLGPIHPCGRHNKPAKKSWFKKSRTPTTQKYCSPIKQILTSEEPCSNLCTKCQSESRSAEEPRASGESSPPATPVVQLRLRAMGVDTEHMDVDWDALDKAEKRSRARSGLSPNGTPAEWAAEWAAAMAENKRNKDQESDRRQPGSLSKTTPPQPRMEYEPERETLFRTTPPQAQRAHTQRSGRAAEPDYNKLPRVSPSDEAPHVVGPSERRLQENGINTSHLHRVVDFHEIDAGQRRLQRNLDMTASRPAQASQQSRASQPAQQSHQSQLPRLSQPVRAARPSQQPSRVGANAISLSGPILQSPRTREPLRVANSTPPEYIRGDTGAGAHWVDGARLEPEGRRDNSRRPQIASRPPTSGRSHPGSQTQPTGQPQTSRRPRQDTRPQTSSLRDGFATLRQGEHPNVAYARHLAMEDFERRSGREPQLVDPATVPVDTTWQGRTYTGPQPGASWVERDRWLREEVYPDDPELPQEPAVSGPSNWGGALTSHDPYATPETRPTGDRQQSQSRAESSAVQGDRVPHPAVEPSPPRTAGRPGTRQTPEQTRGPRQQHGTLPTPPGTSSTAHNRQASQTPSIRHQGPPGAPGQPDPFYRHPSAVPEPLVTPSRSRPPGESQRAPAARADGHGTNYVTAPSLPEYAGHLERENRGSGRTATRDTGQSPHAHESVPVVPPDTGRTAGEGPHVHFSEQRHPRHDPGSSSRPTTAHASTSSPQTTEGSLRLSRSGAIRRDSRPQSLS